MGEDAPLSNRLVLVEIRPEVADNGVKNASAPAGAYKPPHGSKSQAPCLSGNSAFLGLAFSNEIRPKGQTHCPATLCKDPKS